MVISTDRGRLRSLESLLNWQEQGGYELPEAVRHAAAVHAAALALAVPDAPALRHVEDVAALAVDMLARGELVDPVAMAADAAAARALAAALDDARRLTSLAVESAGLRAVAVATDACDEIVGECLRPAFEGVLTEAQTLAQILRGHDLADGGWNAPPKVREARRLLSGLADRHRLIRAARNAIAGLAGREPEHDTAGQFSQLQHPQALVPDYQPNRPLPRPEIPESPEAALLFLVTDGASGKPWLPTTLEQDEAWLAVFGAALDQRRAGSEGARATAGLPV